jgi:hypothetical protein
VSKIVIVMLICVFRTKHLEIFSVRVEFAGLLLWSSGQDSIPGTTRKKK